MTCLLITLVLLNPQGAVGLEVSAASYAGQREVASEFGELTWTEITSGAQTWTYTYDNMNRLVDVLNPTTGHDEYIYNDLGQLVTKTTALGSTHNTYDRLGRLSEVAGPEAGAAYRYYGPTWMRRSAQTPAGLTSYTYDGFACVSQTTGGVTTNYAVPGSAPLWETTNNNVLGYQVDGTGNVTGLYGNLGGGQAGWAVRYAFDAFGNRSVVEGQAQDAHGSTVGYRGQLHDAGTDQVYLRNRYYDPLAGRFHAPDPSGTDHMYAYAGGDPVNAWDPWGCDWVWQGGEWVEIPDTPAIPMPLVDGTHEGEKFTSANYHSHGYTWATEWKYQATEVVDGKRVSWTETLRKTFIYDERHEEIYVQVGGGESGLVKTVSPKTARRRPATEDEVFEFYYHMFKTRWEEMVATEVQLAARLRGVTPEALADEMTTWHMSTHRNQHGRLGKRVAVAGAIAGGIYLVKKALPIIGDALRKTKAGQRKAKLDTWIAAKAAARRSAARAAAHSREVAKQAAELRPYGGSGGGHHVPAKSAFTEAAGYDPDVALAIPNPEMARLGVSHSTVTGAQMTGYRAFAKTGAPLTWEAVAKIETKALIRAGMAPRTANATARSAIKALQKMGVAKPTRIPWGG